MQGQVEMCSLALEPSYVPHKQAKNLEFSLLLLIPLFQLNSHGQGSLSKPRAYI